MLIQKDIATQQEKISFTNKIQIRITIEIMEKFCIKGE